ncbi:MAG: hypothetical protein ACLUE2_09065 [Bacteroides cellulosilyticus]
MWNVSVTAQYSIRNRTREGTPAPYRMSTRLSVGTAHIKQPGRRRNEGEEVRRSFADTLP